MDQPVAPTQSAETLYDRDYAAWAVEQAARLREAAAGNANGLDWLNLAEEIEALAGRDRRELASHVKTIAEHLMKLEASPASNPRAGWRNKITNARQEIGGILEQSPSLARSIPDLVRRETPKARRLATDALWDHDESPHVVSRLRNYQPNQIIDDWWPD